MITVTCMTCHSKLRASEEAIGTVQRCPRCKHFVDLRFPELDDSLPEPPPPEQDSGQYEVSPPEKIRLPQLPPDPYLAPEDLQEEITVRDYYRWGFVCAAVISVLIYITGEDSYTQMITGSILGTLILWIPATFVVALLHWAGSPKV